MPVHPPRSGALFEQRPALRKLIVLADAGLLAAPGDTAVSQDVLLTGLLTHPYIELLRYSDDGPPPDAPRRPYGPPEAGLTAAEGWAELQPPEGGDNRGLVYANPSEPVVTSIQVGRTDYARRNIASPEYSGLDPADAADRRVRDATAFLVAEKVGADLYITDRPYLLGSGAALAQGVTACRIPEALGLVGLYLRSQNEFITWKVPNGATFSMYEWLYYWVGTRELLPTAWRWFAACVQESQATNDDTLTGLGSSLLRRVQRALQARDRFHRTFKLPQNIDIASATLSELDAVLVGLMGSVDVSARVAHLVLSLTGSPINVGWQRTSWLASVSAVEPPLGALFAKGTVHQNTLTILRLLRNTVHSQILTSISVHQAGHIDTVIRLPSDHEAEILAAMDAVGGRTTWGVRTVALCSVVDPDVFMEKLFPNVLALLNEVLRLTPVERLGQVHLVPADSQPPPLGSADEGEPFAERNRLSIHWQLGF